MISFAHSQDMAGLRADAASEDENKIYALGVQKQFQKTPVKHGNNGLQRTRQVTGRMAIITPCGSMKKILTG
jgi:hypothetical protein